MVYLRIFHPLLSICIAKLPASYSCFIFLKLILLNGSHLIGAIHTVISKIIRQNKNCVFVSVILCVRERGGRKRRERKRRQMETDTERECIGTLFWTITCISLVFFHNVHWESHGEEKNRPDLSRNFHFKFKTDLNVHWDQSLLQQRMCTCKDLSQPKNGTIASHKCGHRYFLFGYRILS